MLSMILYRYWFLASTFASSFFWFLVLLFFFIYIGFLFLDFVFWSLNIGINKKKKKDRYKLLGPVFGLGCCSFNIGFNWNFFPANPLPLLLRKKNKEFQNFRCCYESFGTWIAYPSIFFLHKNEFLIVWSVYLNTTPHPNFNFHCIGWCFWE